MAKRELESTIRSLRAQGLNMRKISESVGVSQASVSRILAKLALRDRV